MLDASSRLPATTNEHPSPDESDADQPGTLAYGVLVNASATHGAPIFMNLVNSAALQAIVDAKGAEGQGVDMPNVEVGGGLKGGGRDRDSVEGAARLGARGGTESTLPRWGRCHQRWMPRKTVTCSSTAVLVYVL